MCGHFGFAFRCISLSYGRECGKALVAQNVHSPYPCYVLDILCLIVLTIFSDGTLISTLYIIILSEFYLGQTSLMGSVAMGIASIVLFLVAFAVSGALKEQNVNIAMLISNGFNDILLKTLHFLGFNFVLHIYRTNKRVERSSGGN